MKKGDKVRINVPDWLQHGWIGRLNIDPHENGQFSVRFDVPGEERGPTFFGNLHEIEKVEED